MTSPEDKYARRVFMHLDAVLGSISEKASMVAEASALPAFRQAVSDSSRAFMHHVSHPDTDLDTVDIHGWPWPAPEDYLAEMLSLALEQSIEEAPEPQEPMPDPREAELEALRARVAELETPPPEPEPETHFADLMLADETTDDAKARLSQRLRELRHYLIAPEIRVNEDGSLGLTSAEQAELQDLERRQTLGRWLEA